MTPRRKWLFAAGAIALSVSGAAAVLLAADLYLHRRAERSAGLNRWGYRGPVVDGKRPGETRIAVLGGSTVFGYGVFWDQTIPALLEAQLRQSFPEKTISVVNLGFNNEGAYALQPTLQDFAYLQLDIVAFYTGYNDWWGDTGPNTAVYRHQSPVFRMTGYFPILPLILKEKAESIRTGGQLIAANNAVVKGEAKPVFTPNLAQRTSAGVMETATTITDAISAQLNRLATQPVRAAQRSDTGCVSPWVTYCESLFGAITYGRTHGIKVLVVMPPLMTKDTRQRHEEQQVAASGMVARKFSSDRGVAVVDLSHDVDLTDRHLSFDEMHLDPDGNAVIARDLAPHVRAMMEKS